MIFLTGVSSKEAVEMGKTHGVGLLNQPASYGPLKPPLYPYWAADNGCFTKPIAPGNKNEATWLRWLDRMPRENCLFATVPDMAVHEGKFHDDPAGATLELFHHYRPYVVDLGYKVGFCLQNGSERPGMVPWDDIDCVFIGGTTEWKIGQYALKLVNDAKARGLWAHMGRANSFKRLKRAAEMQVDSADGTFLKWPTTNAPRLKHMLESLDQHPQLAMF